MGQIDHVLLLAATGWTLLPSKETALADTKNTAHPADREIGFPCIDEGEFYRPPSLAQKAAPLSLGSMAQQ
jgi:hypothetical protein